VLFIVYPGNEVQRQLPRKKAVAYRYPRVTDRRGGRLLEGTYEDVAFEKQRSRSSRQSQVKAVSKTVYLRHEAAGPAPAHDREGRTSTIRATRTAAVHPRVQKRSGWIRYPWKNVGDAKPRMKIVRYDYFSPWDWIVAVGSYEDEFYAEANLIKGRIFWSMGGLTALLIFGTTGLVFLASRVLTDPIDHMISVIRQVKKGRFDERMNVGSHDELGELASTFNRMVGIIKRNQEMETTWRSTRRWPRSGCSPRASPTRSTTPSA
jgi:two-component system NtrC family sensor kinase